MLNIKKDFKWFEKNKDLIYADSGATALKPASVTAAMDAYMNDQSTNPHNSDSLFAYQAHEVINECRKLQAELLNCEENEVIFTSGATESLNLFAIALRDKINEGDEIVLTHFEHASNLLPWFNLAEDKKAKVKFAVGQGLVLTAQDFIKQLTPKTKIVSFTGISNVLGNVLPVKEICDAVRKYNPNIFICIDLAQYVPHKKPDVKSWDCDFAAYSGHKMFSAPGIGVAFMKKKWMEELKPLRYGGGMNAGIREDNYTFMQSVEKFEGGTPNTAGIYSLCAATKYLNNLGYDAIHKHEQEIYEMLYSQLKDCSHIIVHNWDAKCSTLAFNIEGVHSQDLAAYLSKHNFIVRSGLSCAKLLDYVVCSPSVVRATFFVYNTKEDIQKFIDFLKQTTKEKVLNELI